MHGHFRFPVLQTRDCFARTKCSFSPRRFVLSTTIFEQCSAVDQRWRNILLLSKCRRIIRTTSSVRHLPPWSSSWVLNSQVWISFTVIASHASVSTSGDSVNGEDGDARDNNSNDSTVTLSGMRPALNVIAALPLVSWMADTDSSIEISIGCRHDWYPLFTKVSVYVEDVDVVVYNTNFWQIDKSTLVLNFIQKKNAGGKRIETGTVSIFRRILFGCKACVIPGGFWHIRTVLMLIFATLHIVATTLVAIYYTVITCVFRVYAVRLDALIELVWRHQARTYHTAPCCIFVFVDAWIAITATTTLLSFCIALFTTDNWLVHQRKKKNR